ncbi:MAG: hypothetical protein HOP04_01750 [Methylophilaceae bacterium]|nr:hypothetical protein [Methylophilaceae bacterium]
MTDTIYAFWDAEQIQYILNAVAMMTSMDDYMGLLKVFSILGLFIAVVAAMVRARGEEAVYYVIILTMIYGILFIPKRDVVIIDTAGGSGTYTVSNVPLGLAFFAGAESHIGYWLTTTMETVFALPGDLQFAKNGMMFASRAITERRNMRFYDKNVFDSLANMTKDCIYPEMSMFPAFYKSVMEGDNMWDTLEAQMNPGRMTFVYDATSDKFVTGSCPAAYAVLTPQIKLHVENDLFPKLAGRLNPNVTPVIAKTLLAAQLPAADDFILKTSRDAVDGIKQAAMINLLEDSLVFVPQMIGDSSGAQVAQAEAVARNSSYVSYKTMAKLAEDSLPVLRSAIHGIILAMFPIIMLLIVMAGSKAGLVLKTYLMALFWVNLWAPIYAVLNFFTSWHAIGGAMAATMGMSTLAPGNSISLTNALMADQSVAGMLALSVPIIAYALTSVSAASMTSIVSGIMAPSNSAAQSAGSQAATGNTSWGNVSMDQRNIAPMTRRAEPGGEISQMVGRNGEITSTYGNGESTVAQPKNDFRIGSAVTSGRAAALTEAADKTSTAAMSHTRAAGKAEEGLLNIARAHVSGSTTSNMSSSGGTISKGGDYGGAIAKESGTQQQASHGAAYSTSNNASVTGKAGANVKGSFGRSENQTIQDAGQASANIGSNGSASQGAQSKTSKTSKLDIGASANGGLDLAQKYAAGISKDSKTGSSASAGDSAQERQAFFDRLQSDSGFRHAVLGSDADSQTTQAMLSNRRTHMDQAQALTSQAESLRQQASQAETSGVQASVNPLQSPKNTEAGLALSRQVEAAPPAQQSEQLLKGVSDMGYSQGDHKPTHYADGSQVKGNQKELDALGAALMKDPAVSDQTKAAFNSYRSKVPGGGAAVGADSAAANQNAGLPQRANEYHDQGKAKHDTKEQMNQQALGNESKRYQGEAGDANPDSHNVATHNKLMNTADDESGKDVEMSLRQVLPNEIHGYKIPGSEPNLEQFQDKIGYKPGSKNGGGKSK